MCICLPGLFIPFAACLWLGARDGGRGSGVSAFCIPLRLASATVSVDVSVRQSLIAIVTVKVGLGVKLYDRNFLDVVRARYCESVCDRRVNTLQLEKLQ